MTNISKFPPLTPPWSEAKNITFAKAMKKRSNDKNTNKQHGEEAKKKNINNFDTDIYTDGSATSSNKDGGAGVVIVNGDQISNISRPAGKFTSSFQADSHQNSPRQY